MILPGAYMTALPPSRGFGSTVVNVFAPTSMTCVVVISLEAPAWIARPSGSTNMNGYMYGSVDCAPVSDVQTLAAGSYPAGVAAVQVPQVVTPATARTRPSPRVMTVGYHRSSDIWAKGDQACALGSKA